MSCAAMVDLRLPYPVVLQAARATEGDGGQPIHTGAHLEEQGAVLRCISRAQAGLKRCLPAPVWDPVLTGGQYTYMLLTGSRRWAASSGPSHASTGGSAGLQTAFRAAAHG